MRLLDAVQSLDGDVETGRFGRWVRFRGAQCTVYVLEAVWSSDYFMWCDTPDEQAAEIYRDPLEAIRAGLQRAGGMAGVRH